MNYATKEKAEAFLAELTQLTHKHGVAICVDSDYGSFDLVQTDERADYVSDDAHWCQYDAQLNPDKGNQEGGATMYKLELDVPITFSCGGGGGSPEVRTINRKEGDLCP